MKGIRHFMRNFSATAVKEHLRSEIEATGGSPDLTKNEIELVRFICEGSFDWGAVLAEPSGASRFVEKAIFPFWPGKAAEACAARASAKTAPASRHRSRPQWRWLAHHRGEERARVRGCSRTSATR
jgi:hypothetical protein